MIPEPELAHRLGVKQVSPIKTIGVLIFLYDSQINIGEIAPFRRDNQRFGASVASRADGANFASAIVLPHALFHSFGS